jgi:hypothetical protein
VDILSSYPASEFISIPSPELPSTFLAQPTSNLKEEEKQKDVSPYISCIWSEWDLDTTSALVASLKKRNVTVQAALSVAGMMAVAYLQRKDSPLPQTFLNQVGF